MINMIIKFEENPYPTVLLVDDKYDIVMKSIAVSGEDAANRIAYHVSDGIINCDDMMMGNIATGSDIFEFVKRRRNKSG